MIAGSCVYAWLLVAGFSGPIRTLMARISRSKQYIFLVASNGSIETRAHLPPMSKRACGDREGATGHAVGRFSVATYRTPLTIFNPKPHFCRADSARKIFQRNISCVAARVT